MTDAADEGARNVSSVETAGEPRLPLGSLIALVVGSMIGGGIFSLPENMAVSAGVGAVLIGWVITGIGMLMLAFVFQTLANRKPELNSGVYAYAKAGFGDYMGFSSAWGYWISAWLGNVSYFVLIFSALGVYVPIFGQGNTVISVVCASVLLWSLHFMVLRGIKEAAFINQITTVAKILPIAIFIIFAALAFHVDVFTTDFWGTVELGSVLHQVKNTMLVTVFVFIGIEGASVYSARAQRRSDVGRATMMGFLLVLVLLVLVNMLSFGIMRQSELAGLQNPSMAGVLERAAGSWGGILISVGLIISVGGALLSWTLLCAEILFSAAKDGTMPRFLAAENANAVPANALWLTNGLIQLFLIITLFAAGTYTSILYLATSMILVPYFWSAAYAVLLAWRGETYEGADAIRRRHLMRGAIAVIYAAWLLYAGGIKYLLLSAILYAPGALLFMRAKREQHATVFQPIEWVILAAVIVGAIIGLYGLYSGVLTL